MRRSSALIAIAFVAPAALAAAFFPAPARAQDEPPSKSICDLPEYEGTAIYEKYCGGGGSSSRPERDDDITTSDPAADARNRISALVNAYPDVIDRSDLLSFDGDNVSAGLTRLRHQVWSVLANASAEAADRRWESAQARSAISTLSGQLQALSGPLQEQATALDTARQKQAGLEADYQHGYDEAQKDMELTKAGDETWLKERNKALKALRAAFPQAKGLPAEFTNVVYLQRVAPPFKPALPTESKPEPPWPVYPSPLYGLLSGQGQYTPAAETVPPYDLGARVGEIESLAAQARANLQDKQAATNEADALRKNFDDIRGRLESANARMESQKRELDYLGKYNSYLASTVASVEEAHRFTSWIKVASATKAIVWDIYTEKVVMPALQQMPHFSALEQANRGGYMIKQVLSLEQNFELLSADSAKILALGSAADTEAAMERVWGSSREQMQATVDRALDLIDAPPAAQKGWKAFFNASKDY